MKDHILPHSKMVNGFTFRTDMCYTLEVDEVLKRNLPNIEKIYRNLNGIINYHNGKKFISLPECIGYLEAMGLKLERSTIGIIF